VTATAVVYDAIRSVDCEMKIALKASKRPRNHGR
jgi:hypothetical protein